VLVAAIYQIFEIATGDADRSYSFMWVGVIGIAGRD